MSQVEAIDWPRARALLIAQAATALDWPEVKVTWGTAPPALSDQTLRFTTISEESEAIPTDVIDASTFAQTQNTIVLANVQCMIEGADPNSPMDLLRDVKSHLNKQSTLTALHTAGLSIVRRPGSSRGTPFRFDGAWVDAASFDLEVRFNLQTSDDPAVETLQITGSGDVSGTEFNIDVTKP